jgi:hypothetical protein
MVREPDATTQPTPQDNQLMAKHRVLSFKPQLRLEGRGQDGQSETEQPDHSVSLSDSISSSIGIRFSVHTTLNISYHVMYGAPTISGIAYNVSGMLRENSVHASGALGLFHHLEFAIDILRI